MNATENTNTNGTNMNKLTKIQAATLAVLVELQTASTEELADALGISESAARGRARRLEALGLVDCERSEGTYNNGSRALQHLDWHADGDDDAVRAALGLAPIVDEDDAPAVEAAPISMQAAIEAGVVGGIKLADADADLTAKESAVLVAMNDSAQAASGGDFGFADEVSAYVDAELGLTQHALAALMGSLDRKGLVELHDDVRVNGTHIGTTQYVVTEEGEAAVAVAAAQAAQAPMQARYVARLEAELADAEPVVVEPIRVQQLHVSCVGRHARLTATTKQGLTDVASRLLLVATTNGATALELFHGVAEAAGVAAYYAVAAYNLHADQAELRQRASAPGGLGRCDQADLDQRQAFIRLFQGRSYTKAGVRDLAQTLVAIVSAQLVARREAKRVARAVAKSVAADAADEAARLRGFAEVRERFPLATAVALVDPSPEFAAVAKAAEALEGAPAAELGAASMALLIAERAHAGAVEALGQARARWATAKAADAELQSPSCDRCEQGVLDAGMLELDEDTGERCCHACDVAKAAEEHVADAAADRVDATDWDKETPAGSWHCGPVVDPEAL